MDDRTRRPNENIAVTSYNKGREKIGKPRFGHYCWGKYRRVPWLGTFSRDLR